MNSEELIEVKRKRIEVSELENRLELIDKIISFLNSILSFSKSMLSEKEQLSIKNLKKAQKKIKKLDVNHFDKVKKKQEKIKIEKIEIDKRNEKRAEDDSDYEYPDEDENETIEEAIQEIMDEYEEDEIKEYENETEYNKLKNNDETIHIQIVDGIADDDEIADEIKKEIKKELIEKSKVKKGFKKEEVKIDETEVGFIKELYIRVIEHFVQEKMSHIDVDKIENDLRFENKEKKRLKILLKKEEEEEEKPKIKKKKIIIDDDDDDEIIKIDYLKKIQNLLKNRKINRNEIIDSYEKWIKKNKKKSKERGVINEVILNLELMKEVLKSDEKSLTKFGKKLKNLLKTFEENELLMDSVVILTFVFQKELNAFKEKKINVNGDDKNLNDDDDDDKKIKKKMDRILDRLNKYSKYYLLVEFRRGNAKATEFTAKEISDSKIISTRLFLEDPKRYENSMKYISIFATIDTSMKAIKISSINLIEWEYKNNIFFTYRAERFFEEDFTKIKNFFELLNEKNIISKQTTLENVKIKTKYKNSNDLKILLTIPHSHCIDEENEKHTCDLIALESAILIKKNNYNFSIINGDVSRTTCDLNRKEFRNTQFRKKIRNYINENDIKFVVDVHSFPNKSNPNLETYILDDYKFNPTDYCIDVVNYLKKKGVKTKLIKGKNSDIEDEMRMMGFKSFLIEFNESLGKDRLKEIATILNIYLNKL